MHNLRLAFRTLLKTPGFTAVAVGVLALGIGASTTIFSIVHSLLLAPLPYPDAGRLMQIESFHREQGATAVAPATFVDLASAARSFEFLAAQRYDYSNLSGDGAARRVTCALATADYFKLLGVPPLFGRTWTDDEARTGAAPVIVLGEALWRGRFNADPGILRREVMIDDVAHTVVGVMPASFKDPYGNAELWRPLALDGEEAANRIARFWGVAGRLKAGVTPEQAGAEVAAIAGQLESAHGEPYRGWTLQVADLRSRIVGDHRTGLLVVLGAVGCVLLITCANVAGLTALRAASRRKELAIRTALGASRGRLVRQLLTESLLLALAGGAGGILLARWGVDGVLASMPEGWLPRADEVALSLPVLGTALGLTLFTGLAFGLAPALTASRIGAQEALKDGSRGSGGPAFRRLRTGMVVAEIALALVLLVGAALLGRSFIGLLGRESGVEAERILTLTVSLSAQRYDTPAKRWDFYSRAEAEVAAVPGIQASGFTQTAPFRWGIQFTSLVPVRADGTPAEQNFPQTYHDSVSTEYFATIGSPLLAGRLFTEADRAGSRSVAIISESTARRFFGSDDPIGREIASSSNRQLRLEVVGVVRDVRRAGLAAAVPLQLYRPLAQRPTEYATLMVRTALPPATLSRVVQDALARVDPDTPVSQIATLDTLIRSTVAQPRLHLVLFTLFAGFALLLSAIGLYGLVAYGVSQRTREFGIRTALGAGPREMLALVLKEGAVLVALGLVCGLAGAFAAVRLLRQMVYEISPYDPAVFLGVTALLAAVALAACLIPARRATRVDPMTALRAE